MDWRAHIQAQIADLSAQLEAGKADSAVVELDQSRVGRLSRMDAMQARAMNVETRRRRQLQLTRLRAALTRLDDDAFGECHECGEPNSEKRLQHDPASTLCIQCARNAER